MNGVQLRRGNLTWWHVAVLSVAFMGPAASVILNTPLVAGVSFTALPLAFVLSLAAVLLNVNTVNVFASRYPSSGSFYAYASATVGPRLGFLSGWMLAFAYFLFAVGGFCAFTVLASDFLLTRYGVHIPHIALLFGSILFVVPLSALGIKEVLETDLLFLVFEFIVLLGLAATIFASQHSLVGPALANAAGAATTWPGIGRAMLFSVLCFLGFESGLVLGEEVDDPLHTVPKGVLWASVVAGVFFVVVSLAGVVGFSAISRSLSPSSSPYWILAGEYWGRGWVNVIQIVALVSILAFVLAAVNALARVLFAMSRDWRRVNFLTRTGGRSGTPIVALASVGLASLLAGLLAMVVMPSRDVWTVLGETGAIAMLLVYLTANVALMREWVRRDSGQASLVRHFALPAMAAALVLVPLASSVPRQLAPASAFVSPGAVFGWLLLGLVCFEVRSRRNPCEVRHLGCIPALTRVSLQDLLREVAVISPISGTPGLADRGHEICGQPAVKQRRED